MAFELNCNEILQAAAFIPSYRTDFGQGVLFYFRDGRKAWLPKSPKALVNHVGKAFAIDLKEARRRFSPLLGTKNLCPIAVTPFCIFVPVKVRKPLLKGDSAYGYFRLRSLLAIEENPPPCTLHLEGGHLLTVAQACKTVKNRVKRCKKLEGILFEEHYVSINAGRNHKQEKPAGNGTVVKNKEYRA